MREYLAAKHPRTGQWHVIGYAGRSRDGRRQYVVVSDGFGTKSEALKYIPHLLKANAAAKQELASLERVSR
jgi:hypothetical protein